MASLFHLVPSMSEPHKVRCDPLAWLLDKEALNEKVSSSVVARTIEVDSPNRQILRPRHGSDPDIAILCSLAQEPKLPW